MKSMYVIAMVIVAAAGCSTTPSNISDVAESSPEEQIVWVGTGTSWVYADGEWSYDGSATVTEDNLTETTYSGDGTVAGEDDSPEADFSWSYSASISENGTDMSSYQATTELVLTSDGTWEPRFRITQEYRYEEGVLVELVELFKVDRDGQENPFARIEEEARMFYPRQ